LGKVIALKLTDKEERIINKLNEEGISNSELIRDALWYYFRTVNDDMNPQVNPVNQKVNPEVNHSSQEKNDKIFYEYIFRLKNEINQLREESNKFQKNFQEEIRNIHSLFDEGLSAVNLTKKEPIIRKENDFYDVHNAIDEFLRKK
jgi:hypothetical protein